MAEFTEVMNKFNKLCMEYECDVCPFKDEGCMDAAVDNPEEFEKKVMEWQPEIYPTFLELIHYLAADIPNGLNMPLRELVMKRVPADKAKELGLMPINECGLTKYTDEDEDIGSEWR